MFNEAKEFSQDSAAGKCLNGFQIQFCFLISTALLMKTAE